MNKNAILYTLIAAACVFAPAVAYAHPGHGAFNGFAGGFSHPLLGLDHMVVMIAVGLWAALQRTPRFWAIPVAFLLMMAIGGLAGTSFFALPGTEAMIGLSVVVLGFLVIFRARFNTFLGAGVVGLFAFFHGYAHVLEMPTHDESLTYCAGFLIATALLHGLGFVLMRVAERASRVGGSRSQV